MPFFKIDQQMVYYAHVPKCGGSSIANYIRDRFGPLAFHDNSYSKQAAAQRWTASSPQHVDVLSLERLIPLSFFSACFAIVRHPVGRAVSTYHFQLEVEKSIPEGTSFTDWLNGLDNDREEAPFVYDNHTRPMCEIVLQGAAVFYMEHGLDAVVPWFDALAGMQSGPRAIIPENIRGEFVDTAQARAVPTQQDLDVIARIYAADFDRFGYVIGNKMPDRPAPDITPAFMAARDRDLVAATRPWGRIKRKALRKLRRL